MPRYSSDLQKERTRQLFTKHGHTRENGTAEYRSWKAMTQRCTNRRNPKWDRYGGRGITVCDRWRQFENFFADMGTRPIGKTLDRYPDPDGNYEPCNCRWATPKEQQANRRLNGAKLSAAVKQSWITRRQKYGTTGRIT
jgi:hypothetical protein